MATTIEYYQRAVRDYEDQVRDRSADLAFLNEQIATAQRRITEVRAQARAAPSGSEEQAVLLENLNNLTSRRNELEARQVDTSRSLELAQSSLQQSQADLDRVSQGEPAPAPPTPAAPAADPEVRQTQAETQQQTELVPQREVNYDPDQGSEVGYTAPDTAATEPPPVTADDVATVREDPNYTAGDEETFFAQPEDQELGDFTGYGPQGEVNLDTEALVPREQGDGNLTGYGEEDEEPGEELVRARNESTTIDSQRYQVVFDPSNVTDGPYYIRDVTNGSIAAGGFQSELAAQTDANLLNSPDPTVPDQSDAETARLEQANADAGEQTATLERARQQAALKAQQRQINRADWRVRLTLADSADYLYMDPGAGQQSVLYPLKVSNGVVFPYTPKISTSYRANYDAYDLTHSNYRGYFYKSSNTDSVSIMATFTAQDTHEANYVLAVIHFFRAVTRMFYGANDPNRGTPPPLVFLHGLGQYQFSGAPCVVSNFMYSLPDDVDYIRAGSANTAGLQDLNYRRDRAALPTNVFTSAIERLRNAGLPPGAEGNTTNRQNFPDKIINSVPVFGQDDPTYVPTKIDIEIELLPMQSRQQISQEYNFADYASGKLITRGYW